MRFSLRSARHAALLLTGSALPACSLESSVSGVLKSACWKGLRIGSSRVARIALAATWLLPLTGCEHARAMAAKAERTRNVLTQACNGEPNAGSAPYVPGSATKVLAAERDGKRGWTEYYGFAPEVAPQEAAEASVVLCLEPKKQVEAGECNFNRVLKVGIVKVPGTATEGPSFKRSVETRVARLVEARTGKTVAESEFFAEPHDCAAPKVGKPKDSDFVGRLTGVTQEVAWVKQMTSRQGR